MNQHPPILEMKKISKKFPGVLALNRVSFELLLGEVHVLMGENGAGKSTLLNILNGIFLPDLGTIIFKGRVCRFSHPRQVQALGISFIHQELNLIEALSVAENIFIGREFQKTLGWVDWQQAQAQARQLLDQLGVDIDPREKVERLSLAEQQMVEIAKALSLNADVICMDEPTASLTYKEVDRLFDVIRELKGQGRSIIYVSHKIEEILQIGDRVTVLRDGQRVDTKALLETSGDEIVQMMVGNNATHRYLQESTKKGTPLFQVKHLSTDEGNVQDVSFELFEGEILGIFGLLGSGRTELLEALYGDRRLRSAELKLRGKPIRIRSPKSAIRAGFCYVPEDRKNEGLFLSLTVKENVGAASLGQHTKLGYIRDGSEIKAISTLVEQLGIVTPSLFQPIKFLSGGNQQKAVIAKGLKAGFKVLLIDEPTRGIDVGAKVEIYKLLNTVTAQGAGIVLVSSELPEILQVSDRIMVMSKGRVIRILDKQEATQENIMNMAIYGANEREHALVVGTAES